MIHSETEPMNSTITMRIIKILFSACALLSAMIVSEGCHNDSTNPPAAAPSVFTATALAADTAGYGTNNIDPNLRDPWGLAINSSTFWIADRASGRTSYYDSTGALRSSYTVAGGNPTGIVADTFSGSGFSIAGYGKAAYIYSTLSGSIAALPSFYNSALVVDSLHASSSSFTGLAAVNMNGGVSLYAPNIKNASLDVFDQSFNRVEQISGKYAGYTPFNVVVIDTLMYVTYARTSGAFVGTGAGNGGYIDVYNLNGVFLRNFSSSTELDEPWGMAIAPSNFGSYSGKLLIGNFGNGTITVFDPSNGNYLGTLNSSAGPLTIQGLWSLEVSNGTLYYTSGPEGGADGVFGKITMQ